jgi:copper chaperone CopZ
MANTLVSQAQTSKKIDKVTFDVNLHCHNCVNLMMKNLPYEKGVKDVKVDLENKEITILFRDDKNSIKQLQEAIEKLGYTANEVSIKIKNKKNTDD